MSNRRSPEIAGLFRAAAGKIAEAAPEGWQRAELSASAHRYGGVGGRGVQILLAHGEKRFGGFLFPEELREISRLDDTGADELTMTVSIDAAGGFEAFTSRAVTEDLGSDTGGVVYALRPGVRPADPGDDQDGPGDATQAGDPREAVRLLQRYLLKRAEIFKREDAGRPHEIADVLPEPLDADRIAHLERDLGVPLPDDLRALYAVADGDDGDFGHRLMCGHIWFTLEELVSGYRGNHRWAAGETWRYHRLGRVHGDAGPCGTVRRSVHRPGWIPFTTDTGGNFLAIDMDPAKGGRPGQVIRVGRDYGEGAAPLADSVTALLRSQLEALERGDYEYDRESGFLQINSDLPDRHPEVVRCFTVDSAAAAHGDVQAVYLRDKEDADLEPLRGARRLRLAALLQTSSVDLAPLRETPVESLELDLEAVDLTPLAGHPTLRALKIRTGEPVDLTPLRTCPRVYGLDLSRASVRGIEVVAELEGLLYLSMRDDQWAELRQRVERLPNLAAAGLADHPTPGTVAEWAERFAAEDHGDDLHYYSGRWNL